MRKLHALALCSFVLLAPATALAEKGADAPRAPAPAAKAPPVKAPPAAARAPVAQTAAVKPVAAKIAITEAIAPKGRAAKTDAEEVKVAAPSASLMQLSPTARKDFTRVAKLAGKTPQELEDTFRAQLEKKAKVGPYSASQSRKNEKITPVKIEDLMKGTASLVDGYAGVTNVEILGVEYQYKFPDQSSTPYRGVGWHAYINARVTFHPAGSADPNATQTYFVSSKRIANADVKMEKGSRGPSPFDGAATAF